MSTVFAASQFFDTFKISRMYLEPMWRQSISRTTSGETLVKDLGPMLWRAFPSTVPMLRREAQAFESRILQLRGGINLFEAYDSRNPRPISEPDTDTSGVTVLSVKSDRTAFNLSGLPVGFQLTIGDRVSVDDGVNLHLFYLSEDGVVGGTGETGYLRVEPDIRAGIAAGNSVALSNPCARFMITPSTVKRSTVGRMHEAYSFEAVQVYL